MTSVVVKAIDAALHRRDLGRAEMADVIGQLMDGEATPAQIGGLLIALRAKGESVDEIVGAASAMRARALPLEIPRREHSIDTCGTGGDGAGTINISTLAALLIAACGGVVAKHGNRALSSKCGSADVLEHLGIRIEAEPAVIARCISIASIGFAYAPKFHAATRHVGGPRKELGTRTIFNLLGPLTNPANVAHQVMGVYDSRWCEPLAAALGALGLRRAAVVHGAGGIDEIAIRGETLVAIWDEGIVSVRRIQPRDFGVDELDPAELKGGDAAYNASVLTAVLAGIDVGPGQRNAAALRAAALTAALGLELLETGALDLDRLPDQYIRASTVATDGAAQSVLERWREASRV
ncbi:MAG TPA: anthranilate phosphoribosyltransferase [Kofleriaceae bacterium]